MTPRPLFALVLLASACILRAADDDGNLATLVRDTVTAAGERFSTPPLRPDQIAVTVVDLSSSQAPRRAAHRGDAPTYPASVIKLFYLAAAQRWMEDGRLPDTPELRRAMRDMIVDSSNDATHYVIDVLTGTTSGPELSDQEIKVWFDQRNAVNRYFASIGYRDINANKKPWGDGPYGRETQAIRLFEPKRNSLTTDATARLLVEIAQGQCVSAARSREMMALLARDISTSDPDPDHQAKFSGPALPAGAKLWSKAGWTSQTRHDALYAELPNGKKFVLVVFTTDHASDREILRFVAGRIAAGL
jgi:beta-lactamase class A